jgi:glyoxylase-like metal-dependent hydrolase (beta-lactamase superfamily II)
MNPERGVLPCWATLVRAPNPGPMTLDGTNTWVLRPPGGEGCLVVDPGPLHEGHLLGLTDYGPVLGILVTHGHPDHIDGVPWLSERTGAPVYGPPIEALPTLAGLSIERIATPGHTADSVCLRVSLPDGSEPAVLTGDTILGRGSTVVAWPDGDLGDYLASLDTLSKHSGVPALPGHGPALADCAAAAHMYLRHRHERLDQVRAAIADGASNAQDVIERVYADVDRSLWFAAQWSVRAQLAYLRRESQLPSAELDEP